MKEHKPSLTPISFCVAELKAKQERKEGVAAQTPLQERLGKIAVPYGLDIKAGPDKEDHEEVCLYCKYWDEIFDDEGYCYRYPPSIAFGDTDATAVYGFPIVTEWRWCGEFKKKVVKGEYPKRPNITPEHVAL